MSSWDVRIEVDPERVPAIRVTTPGLPAGLTTSDNCPYRLVVDESLSFGGLCTETVELVPPAVVFWIEPADLNTTLRADVKSMSCRLAEEPVNLIFQDEDGNVEKTWSVRAHITDPDTLWRRRLLASSPDINDQAETF